VRIPERYLWKETVGTQTAFLVDDRKGEGDDFDGVLGITAFQCWKVAFDFKTKQVFLGTRSCRFDARLAVYKLAFYEHV